MRTIGEAIRKRRLDLGLRQVDVAKLIGCDKTSVLNWEKGHTSPREQDRWREEIIKYGSDILLEPGIDRFVQRELRWL